MPVTRSPSRGRGYTVDCRAPARGAAMLVTRCSLDQFFPPSLPIGTEQGGHVSTAPHACCAGIDQGLSLDDLRERVCLPCPCFLTLPDYTLSGGPPHRARGSDETGRLVGGSCTMALPVPWCLPRRLRYISEPQRGGRPPAIPGGERTAAAPAPRALTRSGFITVPRNATRYRRVILAHEAIACPGTRASAAGRPARAA